jgi:hypothetical protein
MTGLGQILSFDRGAGEEGSRLGVEIRNQLDQQPKEAVMAAIDYRSDRHPSGRRRSPRAAEKEDGSACAARGARASAARERPQRLVLTLSRARRAKGPCRSGKRFAVALGLPVRGFFSEDVKRAPDHRGRAARCGH